MCVVAAGAVAWFVAERFGSESWTCGATMLYARNEVGAPHYSPPEINTFTAQMKSPATLDALAREFNLNTPLKALSEGIKTDVPFGSNTIHVTLQADTLDQSRRMLDRLMQMVEHDYTTSRAKSLGRLVADFEISLQECKQELARAKASLARFNREHGVIDVDRDIERFQQEVAALELALESARMSRAGGAAVEAQRRAGVLRERIRDENEAIALESQLALKLNEFERARALHDKLYISDAEFRRVEAELQALQAQRDGVVSRWKEKVKQYDRQAEAIAEGGVPDEAQAASAPTLGAEIAGLETLLAEKRREIARLSQLRAQAQTLDEDADVAAAERQRVETLLATFKQLQASQAEDLTVQHAAAPTLDPVRSTGKKLLLMTFAGAWLALALPAFLLHVAFPARRSRARSAAQIGLPMLVEGGGRMFNAWGVEGRRAEARAAYVRKLALRIQQSIHQRGSVVLFGSLGNRPVPAALLFELGECLAQRGERVLALDTQGAATGEGSFAPWLTTRPVKVAIDDRLGHYSSSLHPRGETQPSGAETAVADSTRGLADYLASPWLEAEHVISPSSVAGVDALTAGSVALEHESLGTQRLTELLQQLREKYTLVLVSGPGMMRGVDVEMLAARADGIVVSLLGERGGDSAGEATVRDLIALGAPLVGAIG